MFKSELESYLMSCIYILYNLIHKYVKCIRSYYFNNRQIYKRIGSYNTLTTD